MHAEATQLESATSSFLLHALEAAEAQIAQQARELEATRRELSAMAEENASLHRENEALRVKLGER